MRLEGGEVAGERRRDRERNYRDREKQRRREGGRVTATPRGRE